MECSAIAKEEANLSALRAARPMKVSCFDIVRRVNEQKLLWLEDTSDLEKAKSRIQELAFVWPGEFEVIDRCSHRIVAKVVGPMDEHSRRTSYRE